MSLSAEKAIGLYAVCENFSNFIQRMLYLNSY